MERKSAWRRHRGSPPAQIRRGSPRPRGPPRLPLWGFTCVLPRTLRESPRTWDAAGASSRPAAPARGWLGSTELYNPPYPTCCLVGYLEAAPLLEPRGTITAPGAVIHGSTYQRTRVLALPSRISAASRIWNVTLRTHMPLARPCWPSRSAAWMRCCGPGQNCAARRLTSPLCRGTTPW